VTFFGTLASYAGFVASVRNNNDPVLYLMSGVLGLFITAILPVSLQGGVECSLPVPEGISGNMVMMSAQFFGIIAIVLISLLSDLQGISPLYTSYAMTGCVGLSCLIVLLYRDTTKVSGIV